MSKAPPAPAPAAEEPPVAGGKSKLLILILAILVVLLLIGGGAAAYYFLHQPPPTKSAEARKKASADELDPSKPPVYVALEPMTVNLSPEDGNKVLQISMSIQLRDDKDMEAFKTRMPQIRDRLEMLLSAQKGSVLLTPQGKETLKHDILTTLSKPYAPNTPAQKVYGVSFTSFIIQDM